MDGSEIEVATRCLLFPAHQIEFFGETLLRINHLYSQLATKNKNISLTLSVSINKLSSNNIILSVLRSYVIGIVEDELLEVLEVEQTVGCVGNTGDYAC